MEDFTKGMGKNMLIRRRRAVGGMVVKHSWGGGQYYMGFRVLVMLLENGRIQPEFWANKW